MSWRRGAVAAAVEASAAQTRAIRTVCAAPFPLAIAVARASFAVYRSEKWEVVMRPVFVSFVAAATLAASVNAASASPGMVIDAAYLRAGPAVASAALAELPAQTSVDVGRCMHGWCRVASPAGTGFVAAALLGPLRAARYASALQPPLGAAPTSAAATGPHFNARGLLFVVAGLAGPAAFLVAAPSQ
ncbi:SH3 domain-containing protein [Methylocystis sp. IM3]|uniref:SH3 domain-containing protein n=1 Tax=unclassified Methylocystis TaxID=2625913 RepID=UPI0031192695